LDEERQQFIRRENPSINQDWHPHYGDRKTQLVFIGTDLDQQAITEELDSCLLTESELAGDWSQLPDPFRWKIQTAQ
jgi:hypothetical protein